MEELTRNENEIVNIRNPGMVNIANQGKVMNGGGKYIANQGKVMKWEW